MSPAQTAVTQVTAYKINARWAERRYSVLGEGDFQGLTIGLLSKCTARTP